MLGQSNPVARGLKMNFLAVVKFIIYFASLVGFTYTLVDRVIYYLSRPTSIAIQLFHVAADDYPAVVICPVPSYKEAQLRSLLGRDPAPQETFLSILKSLVKNTKEILAGGQLGRHVEGIMVKKEDIVEDIVVEHYDHSRTSIVNDPQAALRPKSTGGGECPSFQIPGYMKNSRRLEIR